MARIAIIVGHPRLGSYCEALATSYKKGADDAGHEVKLILTAALKFDPILHNGFSRDQPLEEDLLVAHDAIWSADHLVFIFPLWFGTMPALLKGFIERVFQADLAHVQMKRQKVKILEGRSARVIVTTGMPAWLYRWWYRGYAVKMLRHNILGFMGVHPVRTTILGSVERVRVRRREKWLRQVEALGRKAI